MTTNRNGFTTLDAFVAAEVRADIARIPGVSVKGLAERLEMRRATLWTRVSGRGPFSPSLLSAVAAELGTTASEIVARAESAAAEAQTRGDAA